MGCERIDYGGRVGGQGPSGVVFCAGAAGGGELDVRARLAVGRSVIASSDMRN